MTQSIVVQVGQCGNQIGTRFWDLALREHAKVNHKGLFDEPISTFFRNVDGRRSPPRELPLGDGTGKIGALKARAVLIDMEEGVINSLLSGPMREVFDPVLKVSSVSGSGNNWAVGHYRYGVDYRDQIVETVRRAAEACDCLQSFMVLHSMGGGTGSGLGTSVLGMLRDEYPEVYRFVTAVFPSADDDVVTSPYNAMLAMNQLTQHADCVLPVENEALADICAKIDKGKALAGRKAARAGSAISDAGGKKPLPWDAMNNVVAHSLLHLTSGSRFDGALNIDVNEITMNLVPFPKLHYLVSSLTPLYALSDVAVAPRKLDQMFSDAFAPDFQLTKTSPRVRGDVEISDVRRNIERLRPSLRFVPWNREGWKTGLCATPPLTQARSLLTLSNSTCIGGSFTAIRDRFVKLYRSKAYVHHFTSEGMDPGEFVAAQASCAELIDE
eukprot:CAMPEP_0206290352 /NCGR_PEP_ID=MMETSP0106_2-20121207/2576_1 /ASSEMBLY_ACC=CAM_ASM_000206 /TAXON_ID=81532 /ORGANISM="Acanthoeca-like sp., Strain 10tr" /LENGTH=440 /DNA_ID=CAMNT_0053720911 /DNA_START=229 /DNA_END=1548 /DNA_ORIENTATION=+